VTEETVELPVPGFRAALLSLPLPKQQLRDEPLVLAAHGAGDSAQSQCEVWREVIGACGAILCISGTPIGPGEDNGYFFRNHLELEKEVLAALAALQAQFAEHIASSSGVYVSYSQGGTMGALMLAAHGALFSRLVLVEGGAGDWTLRRGKEFVQTGGTRVLLVCGTPGCNRGAAQSVRTLTSSGLQVKHLDVPGGGHAYWGSVATAVAKDWPWVIEGDPRWQ
jgi:predicted esterase